jgi:insertion element IS1 protein InsB
MIQVTMKHKCRSCQSENIVKNGRNASGKQQYRCKGCGAYKVLEPTVRYSEGRKEEILRAYQERASLRGISRAFGVSRPTVTAWLKKTPAVAEGG